MARTENYFEMINILAKNSLENVNHWLIFLSREVFLLFFTFQYGLMAKIIYIILQIFNFWKISMDLGLQLS